MDQILVAFETGAGLLWKALGALIFGYTISAAIQALVTREQMAGALGDRGAKQSGLAAFFGFVSSSCSFAALAATRSVLVKGAHPVNALAFLISSTNLVIELGIVLWVLVGWRLLGLIKDILFGFTVAGFIAVFVPQSFWNALFMSSGDQGGGSPTFLIFLENALVAPVVAFFTFIGSMGNVPLAAMLWSKNASFGGLMAFLGAATVIWVHAKYYGWRYALYLSALLYLCMVAAGITVHYPFALAGQIPGTRPAVEEMVGFAIDHTFFLNLIFVAIAAFLFWIGTPPEGQGERQSGYVLDLGIKSNLGRTVFPGRHIALT